MIYIFNTTLSEKYYASKTVDAESYYLIALENQKQFASSENLLADIVSGDAIISTTNASSGHIDNTSTAIDLLKDVNIKSVNVHEQPPFSAKTVNGLKLYTRTTGKEFTLAIGSNNCDFLVPYDNVKFNGIEVMGGALGEIIDLQVLDTPAGLLTTVPYYLLNQFGFTVNIPSEFYRHVSSYDADLIKDMTIRTIVESLTVKTIRINYMIHELKA